MRLNMVIATLIPLLTTTTSCSKSGKSSSIDDSAADTGTDTDTDTDADTDSDSDTDTDTDTDIDTDADTDTDIDTDTNTEVVGSGELTWAKCAGGSEYDYSRSISTLSDGSALVTGEFGGYGGSTATFGLGETNEIVLASDGEEDIFVAKYNADGTLAWAKRAGGSEWDSGYGISTLSDGSALVTGDFGGFDGSTATFGLGETNETVLNSDGDFDIFVAKYNAYGTLVWAKRAGGTDRDSSNDISALSDGSFLLVGSFSDSATFGPGETNETVLISEGYSDIFVAKYNPDGTLAWVKRAGGSYYEGGSSISALSEGSILVTGNFDGSYESTATFGLDETNETVLNSEGYSDIFVAKYNADGTLAWAKCAGGNEYDQSSSVSTLSDGSALVTGTFGGSSGSTATFGLGETNEVVLASDGHEDIFVAKYNADGTLAWAKRAGGSDRDSGNDIYALPGGTALVTGAFGGFGGITATFGPGETNETVLSSDGESDIFMAQYNSDGTLVWAKRAGGTSVDGGSGISACSDGSALVTGSFHNTATFGPGEINETVLSSDSHSDIFIIKIGI